jgi:predicted nucleic acid-binding protein
MDLSWSGTRTFLSTLGELLAVSPISVETHDDALALAERYELSVYDAMIAASALQAGCDTLWSEDLQDGMTIERKLRVINPFTNRSPEQRAKTPRPARSRRS